MSSDGLGQEWRTLNCDTDVASAGPIRWTTKRSYALTRKLRHMKGLEAQTMPRTSSVPVNSEPSTARLCSLTYPFLTCWECLRRMHFGRADISVTDPTETLPEFVAPSTAAAGFSVTPKCTSSRRSDSTTATNRLRNSDSASRSIVRAPALSGISASSPRLPRIIRR